MAGLIEDFGELAGVLSARRGEVPDAVDEAYAPDPTIMSVARKTQTQNDRRLTPPEPNLRGES
ncbi:MAG TPA: hypothetical protein VMU77_05435 [Acidimicrobiales bacterium]|nr:hypothetical protein [Acidimicrobiales bacterium]